MVPPSTSDQDTRLTAERLSNRAFLAELTRAIGERRLTAILSLWPSVEITDLAHAVGHESALPGYGFLSQDGGMPAASKAMFRTIAAGNNVPIPVGVVTKELGPAAAAVRRILDAGWHAIVKAEYLTGGSGNDVYTTDPALIANVGRRTVVVDHAYKVPEELARSWNLLSNDGQAKVIVERFYEASRAVFAEYVVCDEEVRFGGEGEMLFNPRPIAETMPIYWLSESARTALYTGAYTLCSALRAIGYRGNVSCDAIVTAHGEVLFTEYNSRITTSTHIYEIVGKKIADPCALGDRILHDNGGWIVPSYKAAITRLTETGLAFDSGSRMGVVLCSSMNRRTNELMYCAISSDFNTAQRLSRSVESLFLQEPVDHFSGGQCQ